MNIFNPTLVVLWKILVWQEFNLVKKLLWRKRRNWIPDENFLRYSMTYSHKPHCLCMDLQNSGFRRVAQLSLGILCCVKNHHWTNTLKGLLTFANRVFLVISGMVKDGRGRGISELAVASQNEKNELKKNPPPLSKRRACHNRGHTNRNALLFTTEQSPFISIPFFKQRICQKAWREESVWTNYLSLPQLKHQPYRT